MAAVTAATPKLEKRQHGTDSTGQSNFKKFLQAAGSVPDCARLTRRRCWLHDLCPLDPGSTQFPRHLSLRVALCAPRLVVWRGS